MSGGTHEPRLNRQLSLSHADIERIRKMYVAGAGLRGLQEAWGIGRSKLALLTSDLVGQRPMSKPGPVKGAKAERETAGKWQKKGVQDLGPTEYQRIREIAAEARAKRLTRPPKREADWAPTYLAHLREQREIANGRTERP